MKHFWRKIIFADNPAQGAFFALWLLMLGSYLLFSVLLLVIAGDWSQSVLLWKWCKWGWLAGQIGLIAYYIFCNVRFWKMIEPGRYRDKIILLFGLILVVWIGMDDMIGMTAVFVILLPLWWVPLMVALPPSIKNRQKLPKEKPLWLKFGGLVVLLTVWLRLAFWSLQWAVVFGVIAILIIFGGICRGIAWRSAGWRLLASVMLLAGIGGVLITIVSHDYYLIGHGSPLSQLSILSGCRWSFCLSLLIVWLTAAALLYGGVLARAAGLPWRQLWTRPLFALMGLTLAVYALSWGLATASETRVLDMRNQLAQRYGHEISLAGLAEYSPRAQTPGAPEERRQVDQLSKKIKADNACRSTSTVAEGPPGKEACDCTASSLERVKQLDQLLPPAGACYPQNVDRGGVWTSDVDPVGNFILWRLYFAAQSGDTQIMQRYLHNWVDYQKELFGHEDLNDRFRDPFFRCTLEYSLNEYNSYLAELTVLLANGQLSDHDLDILLEHLRQREQELLSSKQAIIYMLCVSDVEEYQGRWRNNDTVGYRGLSAWLLRPFIPAAWYYLNRDLTRSWQRCLDGDAADNQKTNGRPMMISRDQFRRYELGALDNAILIRLTWLRLTEALIEIGQYRQKHGALPESLPDLPIDPFDGKPLRYRLGPQRGQQRNIKRTLPSARVWSVGISRKDDNGDADWPSYNISLDINL